MKFLFILFLFLSCSKVTYTPSKVDKVSNVNIEELKTFELNPQIDMMIFFIWPKDLNIHDEKTVQEIIVTSKRILERKEVYLRTQKKLSKEFTDNECDCHLYYECMDSTEPSDELANSCQEIENEKNKNQEKVLEFYQDYEKIKEMLAFINAELIDVGMDDDYIDIGQLDLDSKELYLKKASGPSFNLTNRTIPFNLEKNEITYLDIHLNLKENLILKAKIDLSPRPHSVIFQGEVELSDGRSGLIYWEHLK